MGARDFCSSACLQSCSSVPEDPASLLINRLAGKWAIKTSLRIELDPRRPAGVVPHSSSMHEEFFKIPGRTKFLFESRLQNLTTLLDLCVSTIAQGPVFCVQHNRHVYNSTKELHLWNLPWFPNCLDER